MISKYQDWQKAKRSEPNGHCVEVSRSSAGSIGVRDTKANGAGPILEFTRPEWAIFVATVRR